MKVVFQSPLVGLAGRVVEDGGQILVGIVTVSDRASAGEYEDEAGPRLREFVEQRGWVVLVQAVVADEVGLIQQAVQSFVGQGCGLVLTTGGTGMTERDVTPEALRGMMRVELPGFGEVMRMRSFELTANAILSRCLAVVVGRAVVIALPGKPQGAVECVGFVADAVPHAVRLARREPTSC